MVVVFARGCIIKELINNPEWFSRPKFLENEEACKAKYHCISRTKSDSFQQFSKFDSFAKRIYVNRFCNWMRLKYVTARILKLYN